MAARKHILFLTTQLPWPANSGGTIKSWKLIEFLSQHFDLSLGLLLKEENAEGEAEFRNQVTLREYCSVPLQRPRSAVNLFLSYLQSPSLNVFRNKSAALADWVAQVAPEADILFVDHYEMFQYVPKHFKGKVVLHEHNAEYVIWERFAELETDSLKRTMLRTEANRVKKAEQKYVERADAVFATPNDIEKLAEIGCDASKCAVTYHLGDDAMLELPAVQWEDTGLDLLFVGTLTWEPNVNGLIWFLDHCWNGLKERFPGLRVHIVGKNPDARLQKRADADEDINLPGFVEKLEPYHRRCRVFLVPLLFGSGMKVKVLHGMYRGMAMVTTEIGAEGIDVQNENEALIVPNGDAAAFQDSIERLLTERELWEKLSVQARNLARRKYSWSVHLEEIRQQLEAL